MVPIWLEISRGKDDIRDGMNGLERRDKPVEGGTYVFI